MAKKKLVPVLLIGSAAAALLAFWPKSSPANNNYVLPPNTNTTGQTNWTNIGESFSNLLNTIVTSVTNITNTVQGASKASGTITGIKRIYISGTYLTGLISPTSISKLKSGNKIKITPGAGSSSTLNNTFTVTQMGDELGNNKDTIIVINKPYNTLITSFSGTFQEV